MFSSTPLPSSGTATSRMAVAPPAAVNVRVCAPGASARANRPVAVSTWNGRPPVDAVMVTAPAQLNALCQ
jgi:hypothetical protein